MATKCDPVSEAEQVLLDEESDVRPQVGRPSRRAALLTASLFAVAATGLVLLASPAEGGAQSLLTHISGRPAMMGLDEEVDANSTNSSNSVAKSADAQEQPELSVMPAACDTLPSFKILKLKSSNLGGNGPDTTEPEGLIYEAKAHNDGLGDITDVELHFHVTSEEAFQQHSEAEGTELDGDYTPAWPKENGIHGGFARVNVKPGTNVTLLIHGYNPATKEDILLPKAAMTFFDLDAGKNGTRSVEYVKIDHYAAYFLTNETEIQVSHEDGSTTFTASKEGTGDDNPQDPMALTVQQKNRAVSMVFVNETSIIVQVGASPGKTARVFSFVLLPALRCAKTVLPDGTLVDANSTDAPIIVVRGAAEQARPLLLLLPLGLALLAWCQGEAR